MFPGIFASTCATTRSRLGSVNLFFDYLELLVNITWLVPGDFLTPAYTMALASMKLASPKMQISMTSNFLRSKLTLLGISTFAESSCSHFPYFFLIHSGNQASQATLDSHVSL